jgi:hypothetical protein
LNFFLSLTIGQWKDLLSAGLGAAGTAVLFNWSWALEPYEAARWAGEGTAARLKAVTTRNEARKRWQRLGLALLFLSFLAQIVGVFLPVRASQANHEEIRGSSQHRHRWASGIFGGDERDRCCCRAARGRRSAQQSRREFASAVSATRTGDAALSKSEDAAEVQLSSCPGAQPIQIRSTISSRGNSAALAEWRALAA